MEPLLGQIMLFSGNFAPRGWAFCDGQQLDIAENEALFSLLGTTYGGDGRTKFGLPDLRGRVPIHAGHGTGLSPRDIGQKVGAEAVALDATQLPEHHHDLLVAETGQRAASTSRTAIGTPDLYTDAPQSNGAEDTPLKHRTTGKSGGGAPHDNMQPSLCINFIIALEGRFPSRN